MRRISRKFFTRLFDTKRRHMKLQSKASSIFERTSLLLAKGSLKEQPAWFKAVGAYPPDNDFTRKPKLFQNGLQRNDPGQTIMEKKRADDPLHTHFKTRSTQGDRRTRNNMVFTVPKLNFVEDELRDVFYHQHPWEFSRPKVVVEGNEANTNSKCNWSRMLQLNKPLDGESVVQRTVWLAKNEQLDIFDAYDKARFEFYRLRMREELNSTVAKEESEMYGAIYTDSYVNEGLKQEQEVIDEWVKEGQQETQIMLAKRSGPDSSSGRDVVANQSSQSVWDSLDTTTPEKSVEKK